MILSFAREAGAVAAIAPVCREMTKRGWRYALLAKGPAVAAFRDRGIGCVEIAAFDPGETERVCAEALGGLPEAVFTSASSLPTLDMTERLLWRWASKYRVPCAALVDQWQNYAIRFSGPDPSEHLAYLPDRILLMDEQARREAIVDGLPQERLVITGQPAFDDVRREHQALLVDRVRLRAGQGIADDAYVVTFVAEDLASDFGDSLGYDEQSTLEFVGDVLQQLSRAAQSLVLVVKLHPQNEPSQFTWALDRWPALKVRLVAREITARKMIAMSDLVVGMTSVMLIEAILAGQPTVSLELDARREPQLVATRAGAIPALRTAEAARHVLSDLLLDPAKRERYVAGQNRWTISDDAVGKCMGVLSLLRIRTMETMQC
jgi:hypothetical protein